ncbi:MAG: response regulator [Halorhodospira sp.]
MKLTVRADTASEKASGVPRTAAWKMDEDKRLRSAAEAVGLGLWWIDPASERVHLCERAQALFGVEQEPSRPLEESAAFYVPEHREQLSAAYRGCLAHGTPYDLEVEAITAEGARRWLRVTGEPVRDAEGAVVAVHGALLDIDACKRRELELLEARQEAERTDRAKSEFLSAMSHELRTPLNAILGFAQLLYAEDDPASARRAEYLRHILSAGWHLRDLVDDILDLARIEAGKAVLNPEVVRLPDLLQECVRLVREQAAEYGLALRLEPPKQGRPVSVWADRLRVKQVVLNLLTNAIKYNRQGGSVVLSYAGSEDGQVTVDVLDTGMGIAPEGREGLFETFDRLGRESGAIQGVGIGLPLALRLTRLMGGDLWLVESTPGVGSRFRLTLPQIEVEGWDRHHEPSLDPQLLEERPDDPPLQLLAVEDDSVNMLLLSGLVAKRQGVELLQAGDGQSALELMQRHQPDLILLDMHLPDTDGFALARRLRALPALRATPLVALSADATDEMREQAMREGFDDYLVKPFELEQLDALIREVRLSKQRPTS